MPELFLIGQAIDWRKERGPVNSNLALKPLPHDPSQEQEKIVRIREEPEPEKEKKKKKIELVKVYKMLEIAFDLTIPTGYIDYFRLNRYIWKYFKNKNVRDVLDFILQRTVNLNTGIAFIGYRDFCKNGFKSGNEVYTEPVDMAIATLIKCLYALENMQIILCHKFPDDTVPYLYILNNAKGREIYQAIKAGKLTAGDCVQLNKVISRGEKTYKGLDLEKDHIVNTVPVFSTGGAKTSNPPPQETAAPDIKDSTGNTPQTFGNKGSQNSSPIQLPTVIPKKSPTEQPTGNPASQSAKKLVPPLNSDFLELSEEEISVKLAAYGFSETTTESFLELNTLENIQIAMLDVERKARAGKIKTSKKSWLNSVLKEGSYNPPAYILAEINRKLEEARKEEEKEKADKLLQLLTIWEVKRLYIVDITGKGNPGLQEQKTGLFHKIREGLKLMHHQEVEPVESLADAISKYKQEAGPESPGEIPGFKTEKGPEHLSRMFTSINKLMKKSERYYESEKKFFFDRLGRTMEIISFHDNFSDLNEKVENVISSIENYLEGEQECQN
jgi:hypothetical protein